MDLRSVIVVLPCDGLGDFPTHLGEADASQVLHSWTAAWRPELLAAAGGLPRVVSAYSPPAAENLLGAIAVIPPLSETQELRAWRDDLPDDQDEPIRLIEGLVHRGQIIASACKLGVERTTAGDRWAPEFYALGYAFVQTELLTHSLSYGSIISLDELERRVVAAAQAAVVGDDQQVEQGLRGAYDLLEQVRAHSFAVETYLLDLVLLSEAGLGEPLNRELDEASPKSFLLSPKIAAALPGENPAADQLLNERCLVATVGEEPLSTAPPETLRRRVAEAIGVVRSRCPESAAAFAQTHGGVPPRLAEVAAKCDSSGLLLTPLDGSPPPMVEQSRLVWQNPDGEFTETLALAPRDAGGAATLLGFGSALSENLFHEHVSTQVFAAWAGSRHELFDDLRRVAARSVVLGRLLTVDQYLDVTSGVAPTATIDDDQLSLYAPSKAPPPEPQCERVLPALATLAGRPAMAEADAAESIAAAVAANRPGEGGRVVVNGLSYERTVLAGPRSPNGLLDLLSAEIVRNTPGLGFRVIGAADAAEGAADLPERADAGSLQNEFMQVLIDPESGGVRTLRTHQRRRNRLSQRLAVRRGPSRIDLPLSVEGVESRVLASTRDRGAVAVSGRLMDLMGGVVADFEQRFYLLAGSPYLFVDVEVDASEATTTLDALRFAVRIALPEADWRVARGVQWSRLPTHRGVFAASDYVHLHADADQVTIAGQAMSEHARFGGRMLDSFLPPVEGGRTSERYVLAIDEPRPLRVALEASCQAFPSEPLACDAAPGAAGWLAHQDCPNVQVSRGAAATGGGVRITLVETDGRSADPRLRVARPPAAAYWIGPGGRRGGMLDLVGESVVVPLNAYESREIELTW